MIWSDIAHLGILHAKFWLQYTITGILKQINIKCRGLKNKK